MLPVLPDAYEREARLLRELRDGAQEEAARAKAQLAELQALHERSGLAHAEVTRRMEQQVGRGRGQGQGGRRGVSVGPDAQ